LVKKLLGLVIIPDSDQLYKHNDEHRGGQQQQQQRQPGIIGIKPFFKHEEGRIG
jgi:hypothetical protein